MSSNMVVIPVVRFCFFGIGDAQARRSMLVLICPHWVVGLVLPISLGGIFTASVGVLLPYSFTIYRVYRLCKEEKRKGTMISIKEEVDAFLEGRKFMRITSMRLSEDRLMFSATGKVYDNSKGRTSLDFLLDPTQFKLSNDIVALLSGHRTRAVSFTDKGAQNIKLVLTRLVGLPNQDSIEAQPLPARQDSLSQRILNVANPTYHFTAVASPYPTAVPTNFYSTIVPSQPVIAVATVAQPLDIEQGPKAY